MREYLNYFSPYYSDGLLRKLADKGLLDNTILGGAARKATEQFLHDKQVPVDYRGERHEYELILIGTDTVLPKNILHCKIVLVQEGMMVPDNWQYYLVRYLGLPRYLGNTAMTGLSHAYQRFCVASEGWKKLFVRKGVDPKKIAVTGIPNFDDLKQFEQNDFPHRNFVLGATSCLRETYQCENRKAFIQKVVHEAKGRPIIFKLHPNENHPRAIKEIEQYAPGSLVYTSGDIRPMIANCDTLITKYSTVLMVALGLGKKVLCDIPQAQLELMRPIQNGGSSAAHIAEVCRGVMNE